MRLTKKAVDSAINGIKWNVRENKTMVMIADSDNPDYWEEQARILIRQCTDHRRLRCAEEYGDKLDQALQLLVLAKIKHGMDPTEPVKPKRKRKPKDTGTDGTDQAQG